MYHPAHSIFARNDSARSARTASGASAASDSLDVVRDIVARFPGPPPRHAAGAKITNSEDQRRANGVHSLGRPPGLIMADNREANVMEDTDSDVEWRELARERSFRRRREMEAEAEAEARRVQNMRQQQTLGSGDAAGAMPRSTDISPVNSIKRKPVPSADANADVDADAGAGADAEKKAQGQARGEAQGQAPQRHGGADVRGVDEAEAEASVAQARGAARGHYRYSSSVDDPASFYSSEDDGGRHYKDEDGDDRADGETGVRKPGTPATGISTTTAGVTPGLWLATSMTAAVAPVTPGPWTPGSGTTAVGTPGPWTPASSTAVAVTPALGTPASWMAAKEGRPTGQDTGRGKDVNSTAVAVTLALGTPAGWMAAKEGRPTGQDTGRGKDVNSYGSTQATPRLLHSSQQPLQLQRQPQTRARSRSEPQPQPQPQPQHHYHQGGGSVNDVVSLEGEHHRLHRLTLLRRELRAALEPQPPPQPQFQTHAQAQAQTQAQTPPPPRPWLHTDPLTQLQSIDMDTIGGRGAALHDVADGDEDADAVLDDAWRRAGLARRIKSVSRVPVHMTPRVEHGFEVRGSLVAVEEEEEEDEDCVGVTRVEGPWRMTAARMDSDVLGEEDRTLIR